MNGWTPVGYSTEANGKDTIICFKRHGDNKVLEWGVRSLKLKTSRMIKNLYDKAIKKFPEAFI